MTALICAGIKGQVYHSMCELVTDLGSRHSSEVCFIQYKDGLLESSPKTTQAPPLVARALHSAMAWGAPAVCHLCVTV